MAKDMDAGFVDAGPLSELLSNSPKLVSTPTGPVLVILDGENVFALDNRCPHMGFPLQQGSVQDGILTCHWHHARFDIRSGCTFDLWADDVPIRAVRIDKDRVWVASDPASRDARQYWLGRLQDGLTHNISLVIAKALHGALEAGVPANELVREALVFGARQGAEWGSGLTSLVACANLMPVLPDHDRFLALLHGVMSVADDVEGQIPRPPCDGLGEAIDPDTLRRWLRQWVRVRHTTGAERTLRTAIAQGASPGWVAATLLLAVTDRKYADGGHALDFLNKAFEGLDIAGWEHAGTVLSSLVPVLTVSRGREESDSWRHPVDLVELLDQHQEKLAAAIANSGAASRRFADGPALADAVLDDDPQKIIGALIEAVGAGAGLADIGRAVALAAGKRLAQFASSNELSDWDTAHHVFTYTNATAQLLARVEQKNETPEALAEILRAALHGAMAVYLIRYLNVPPARLPSRTEAAEITRELPAGAEPARCALFHLCDRQGGLAEAAALVVHLGNQKKNGDKLCPQILAQAMLREDAGFHMIQNVEAALRQARDYDRDGAAYYHLAGAARFLAAHTPTRRALLQTADIAVRLSRDETAAE